MVFAGAALTNVAPQQRSAEPMIEDMRWTLLRGAAVTPVSALDARADGDEALADLAEPEWNWAVQAEEGDEEADVAVDQMSEAILAHDVAEGDVLELAASVDSRSCTESSAQTELLDELEEDPKTPSGPSFDTRVFGTLELEASMQEHWLGDEHAVQDLQQHGEESPDSTGVQTKKAAEGAEMEVMSAAEVEEQEQLEEQQEQEGVTKEPNENGGEEQFRTAQVKAEESKEANEATQHGNLQQKNEINEEEEEEKQQTQAAPEQRCQIDERNEKGDEEGAGGMRSKDFADDAEHHDSAASTNDEQEFYDTEEDDEEWADAQEEPQVEEDTIGAHQAEEVADGVESQVAECSAVVPTPEKPQDQNPPMPTERATMTRERRAATSKGQEAASGSQSSANAAALMASMVAYAAFYASADNDGDRKQRRSSSPATRGNGSSNARMARSVQPHRGGAAADWLTKRPRDAEKRSKSQLPMAAHRSSMRGARGGSRR